MKIQVECYSGYKSSERPIKFWVHDAVLFVESIDDQWRGIDALHFRVHADDGNNYILSYTETTDAWTLESVPPNQCRASAS